MVRSGLQQDVINLYRQGLKIVYTKSPAARPAFLLNLRYSFRNPPLRARDYSAIEYQLRRTARTLEMLEDTSVQRINVSGDMEAWWAGEVERARRITAEGGENAGESEGDGESGGSSAKDSEGGGSEQSGDKEQWGGTLPGPGGT